MKKFILSLLVAMFSITIASADNFKAPTKSSAKTVFTDTTTTHTYEIKEIKYPVYTTKKGAFYIWKISKNTGNKYKYYLPKEIQKQMGRVYKEDTEKEK